MHLVMHVCMYICILYVHVYAHVCTLMYVCSCTHVLHVYIHVHVLMSASTHAKYSHNTSIRRDRTHVTASPRSICLEVFPEDGQKAIAAELEGRLGEDLLGGLRKALKAAVEAEM